MITKPLILVSNDDGIEAKGVHALVERLSKFGDVVCVCPDSPQSGMSMAITVSKPLRIHELKPFKGARMFKTNGTPVDCVKLGVDTILNRKPDLVVSGINHGSNAAVNVVYSGTMGAAFEGCAYGVPSIGFSLTTHDPEADMFPCYPVVDEIVKRVLGREFPEGVCLNVNIPAHTEIIKEIRVVRGCKGRWTDEYKEYLDPAGHKFYWLTGSFINEEPENDDTDEWCLKHGIASVVPVMLDRTFPLLGDFKWLDHKF